MGIAPSAVINTLSYQRNNFNLKIFKDIEVKIAKDGEILKVARETAIKILEEDPHLVMDKHVMIREQVMHQRKETTNWARIS